MNEIAIAGGVTTESVSEAEAAGMRRSAREQIIGRFPRPLDRQDTRDHFRLAARHETILPERVRDALARLRDGATDAVVLHGLPADDRTGPDAPPLLGWTWLAMVTRQLGHEFGYRAEKNGDLVHDVRPRPDGAATQSNASSAVDLSLHTEVAFHDVRPDFVVLYGVRSPQPRPATRLVHIADAVRECRPETVRRLREPRFRIAAPESFSPAGRAATEGVGPIGGSPGWPTVRWHSSITGSTAQDRAAIADFLDCAERVAHRVRLGPGSLVVFSNNRCLHGRDSFTAQYDASDRWLLRTYVLRDVTRLMTRYGPAPDGDGIRTLAEAA
ncbi:TauD/TfdA family dioxygenase [Pseudosporangium ferrugineum]|uniref:L-asparagine oxygenase n=1 Tax=Pseudosporangium ferrugineum TaxID=439699 RepID=A0A2T0SAW0_9ACTN|nr:TauD/TfdA family dioxygenase [Pseudosporangium ferrugineum]PRY30565.1 L-asparagine oxygenase [Pseudosporangium ferrugineum]